MAISSYQAYLMYKSGSYQLLVDIKDFPDLGGSPDMIETTTLSNKAQTYILGIQSTSAMEFTANYDATKYGLIKGLKGTVTDFAVWFGADKTSGLPDGKNGGKFEFKGLIDVHVAGAGVNEAVDMIITIAPTTVIAKAAS
jgi:hypothetical protein